MNDASWRAAELCARASYGRLLSILSARTHDIAAAEDALSEAFFAALLQWNRDGVPLNPDAWLLLAAKRRALDGQRRESVRQKASEELTNMLVQLDREASGNALPDARLRLLFVCTHPAIDPSAQVPLMLQAVLGLDAELIASAFRVSPKTMGQRLWRAKTKIRDAGIPFEVPEPELLPTRLDAVLEAIYAAFGVAWEDVRGESPRLGGLTNEAIFLGRLLVELLPAEAEPLGLLALMLFANARRAARRSPAGAYVPLEQQTVDLWSLPDIAEAEALLFRAFQLGKIGPYQLEAALQSAHVSGVRSGSIDGVAMLALYDRLLQLAPSLGAGVGRAATLIAVRGGSAALQALDELDSTLAREYQPYWAVRAAALREMGRLSQALDAYERAIGLTEDQATRQFLRGLADSAKAALG